MLLQRPQQPDPARGETTSHASAEDPQSREEPSSLISQNSFSRELPLETPSDGTAQMHAFHAKPEQRRRSPASSDVGGVGVAAARRGQAQVVLAWVLVCQVSGAVTAEVQRHRFGGGRGQWR